MMLSDVCLTTSDVCHVHPAGRLGWRVLAHRARPGSAGLAQRLPLRASVARGGGILWQPPTQLVYSVKQHYVVTHCLNIAVLLSIRTSVSILEETLFRLVHVLFLYICVCLTH